MEEKCCEVEELNNKLIILTLMKNWKKSGNTRKTSPVVTRNTHRKVQLTEEDKGQTWKNNYKHLFATERKDEKKEVCILKIEWSMP